MTREKRVLMNRLPVGSTPVDGLNVVAHAAMEAAVGGGIESNESSVSKLALEARCR